VTFGRLKPGMAFFSSNFLRKELGFVFVKERLSASKILVLDVGNVFHSRKFTSKEFVCNRSTWDAYFVDYEPVTNRQRAVVEIFYLFE
jgi:hypothetical protein